jgi:predicted  nucleic acid-binding Zn-ribbon protein
MKKDSKNPKIIAGTLTFLLALSLTGLVFLHLSNQSLETGLNTEKVKSEKMLSEKLAIEKEILKLKQSISLLEGKNSDLDKMLSDASYKIAGKEAELSKMKKENASLQQYRKQLAEVQKIKSDLESQIKSLTTALANSNKEKESLSLMVADLQLKNKNLEIELTQLHTASLDNSRVDAFKKNNLTVKAKKTSRLEANFVIPGKNSSENLKFNVYDPNGKILEAKDGTVAIVAINETPILTADASKALHMAQSKQVKMEYKPKKKLKPGVYKIEILNSDKEYLGSLQVRLK